MVPLQSFREVIALWPTRRAMAVDVGASRGSVHKWWLRDSIPAEWWSSVARSRGGRRAGVTLELLSGLRRMRPAVVAEGEREAAR